MLETGAEYYRGCPRDEAQKIEAHFVKVATRFNAACVVLILFCIVADVMR